MTSETTGHEVRLLGQLFDLYRKYDELFDVPSEHPDYSDDFRLVLFPDGSGWIASARRSITPFSVQEVLMVEWTSMEEGIGLLEDRIKAKTSILP